MEENKEQELEKQEIDNKQEDEITKVKQELEDTTDRYKRIMAEFDNFKKRSLKEREGMYNSLIAQIVTSILPILDNLEKAVSVETIQF